MIDMNLFKKGMSYVLNEYLDESHPLWKVLADLNENDKKQYDEVMSLFNSLREKREVNNTVVGRIGILACLLQHVVL